MVFEDSPSGKVKFLALGELPAPGSCFVCGSGTREEGYVDVGVWLEYIGEALICHTCVVEIGEKIKMMVPEEVQHIQRLAETLTEENTALKTELAAKNERLNHYDSLLAGINFHTVTDTNSPVNPRNEDVLEALELSDSGEPEAQESDSDDGGPVGFGAFEQDDRSSEDESPIKL